MTSPPLLVAREVVLKNGARHLRVQQSRFDERLKGRLQRVGSPARWLPGTQEWDYPLSPAAVVALERVSFETQTPVVWEGDLREYANYYVEQNRKREQVRLEVEKWLQNPNFTLPHYETEERFPDGRFVPPLRPQQIAYHWLQKVDALLLAWEPGTGKTRAAIDAAGGWYRSQMIRPMVLDTNSSVPRIVGGVLVVAPKIMLSTWAREIAKWQHGVSVVIQGEKEQKSARSLQVAHFHIVNYQSLKYVEQNEYDGLIIDEVHACANNTEQTRRVLALAAKARKKIGLSGTPLSNGLESIFYPMLIIDGGMSLGSSKTAFLERYFYSRTFQNFTVYTPKMNAIEEVSKAISSSVFWLKKEEVLDLPEKTFTPFFVEMSAEQRRYYEEVRKELISYIQSTAVTADQASKRMMKLLEICQGFVIADDGSEKIFTSAKIDALMELLTTSLKDQKVIVWAYFLADLKRVAQRLDELKIPYVLADGSVRSSSTRDEQVELFNHRDDVLVFLRQLSLSEGVTLLGTPTKPCSNSIYLGLNYRYVDWIQSQNRIHRIGQRMSCTYRILLTDYGIDRAVYERVLAKDDVVQSVRALSKEYYLELLQTSLSQI